MVSTHIVLGLGATGLSVVRFLVNKGITPVVWDSRSKPPGEDQFTELYPQLTLGKGAWPEKLMLEAKQLIVSPGIAIATKEIAAAAANGVEVIGDVELFAREINQIANPPKLVGITGSNGKSTVTELVAHMAKQAGLKSAVGGNIGVPMLTLLEQDLDLIAVELSSFQLETTRSLNLDVATVLNVSADHLDRYPSFDAYRQAKLGIYNQAKHALINLDDPLTHCDHQSLQSFSIEQAQADWYLAGDSLFHQGKPIANSEQFQLVGRHNMANILAALALTNALDLPISKTLAAAESYQGLPHRCQLVFKLNGVSFVDDSKATNIGATLAALDGFKDNLAKLILIAGGDAKGADVSELSQALAKVKNLICLGQDGDKIAQLKNGGQFVDSMAEAVKRAKQLAEPGDIILLSPACASIDMYPNYMARGKDFVAKAQGI
ncbi:UDP-N-acetylmuramoyl-L-alanine--D-glutamate ligase [Paraferrimonas sp. SM1919]|uniref:UDP-N-acetylmuramoyl-L-alanine--D-glutamate ligase n=1 Tax=Paraferrimonas sp. SM1919 TaxID=2662263 RepID=UPI0013D789B2|nr:UDP-N-acetylmuramoyl-L-alanine--D-glutamate ligase [Paraferrimonas sp. SM1919]